jgi:hypothetical protein
MASGRSGFALAILIAACGPSPRPMTAARPPISQPQSPAAKLPLGIRECATGDLPGPDLAVNFDVFVAADVDLAALFPDGLRQLPTPITMDVLGRSPWPPYVRVDLATVVKRRNILWVECSNLFDDGFDALGDALGIPRPEPLASPRGHDVIPTA